MQRLLESTAVRGVVCCLLASVVACAGSGSGGASGAGQASTPSIERDGSPSWSPDGSRIAFYSERDGNAEIYVMDADGSNPTRLTEHAADEGYPSFSPDGSRLSFDSDRDGNFEVYTMNADGTDVRRLTYSSARDLSASWSPDGSTIAFISDRSGRFEVWLMNADGSNQRPLTGGEGQPSDGTHWFPQWSADGARLTFHVNRDVYTVNVDGSDYVRLTVDPDNGMVPSFGPDGRIVFMSWRGAGPNETDLYAMDGDGADQVRLTDTESGGSIDPRVSPDGSRIVYTWVPEGGGGPKHVMVMNADGTGIRQLTGAAR